LKTITAHLADNITQAIVSAVTTTLLEPDSARRQIQIIMCDQDILQIDLVETRQRLHGLATEVHKGIGLE